MVKVLVWNALLARNNCMFNANVVPVHIIILKINHMLVSWFAATSE